MKSIDSFDTYLLLQCRIQDLIGMSFLLLTHGALHIASTTMPFVVPPSCKCHHLSFSTSFVLFSCSKCLLNFIFSSASTLCVCFRFSLLSSNLHLPLLKWLQKMLPATLLHLFIHFNPRWVPANSSQPVAYVGSYWIATTTQKKLDYVRDQYGMHESGVWHSLLLIVALSKTGTWSSFSSMKLVGSFQLVRLATASLRKGLLAFHSWQSWFRSYSYQGRERAFESCLLMARENSNSINSDMVLTWRTLIAFWWHQIDHEM